MITNTTDIQAVHDRESGIYGIAFYIPGTVELEPGLKLIADNPCLILLESLKTSTGYRITVSDPTAALQLLSIKISKKITGPGAVNYSDDLTVIKFILPSGDEAGKSIGFEYIPENQ